MVFTQFGEKEMFPRECRYIIVAKMVEGEHHLHPLLEIGITGRDLLRPHHRIVEVVVHVEFEKYRSIGSFLVQDSEQLGEIGLDA
jgi:hypothetical protein